MMNAFLPAKLCRYISYTSESYPHDQMVQQHTPFLVSFVNKFLLKSTYATLKFNLNYLYF